MTCELIGAAALLVELRVAVILLRSVADILRSTGEDLFGSEGAGGGLSNAFFMDHVQYLAEVHFSFRK